MKQNSQWLSQVRTWSNSAECTSMPSGSPAALATSTVQLEPAPADLEHQVGLVDEQPVLR